MKNNPFEVLPDTVEIGGASVKINSDFRVGVSIETEMLQEHPDVEGLLKLFYSEEIPSPIEEAAEQMIRFYSHADDENEDGKEEKKAAVSSRKRLYDFSQDADALLSSFWQAYDIDLERDEIHWWKFRRLMFGLPADTPFMQRVHIRSVDLSKVDKSQKSYYRRMKKIYALKQNVHREKMTAAEKEEVMKEKVRRRFEEAQKSEKN